MKLTKEEKDLILNALVEYEKYHCMDNDGVWQININNLIDKFSVD